MISLSLPIYLVQDLRNLPVGDNCRTSTSIMATNAETRAGFDIGSILGSQFPICRCLPPPTSKGPHHHPTGSKRTPGKTHHQSLPHQTQHLHHQTGWTKLLQVQKMTIQSPLLPPTPNSSCTAAGFHQSDAPPVCSSSLLDNLDSHTFPTSSEDDLSRCLRLHSFLLPLVTVGPIKWEPPPPPLVIPPPNSDSDNPPSYSDPRQSYRAQPYSVSRRSSKAQGFLSLHRAPQTIPI